jgi:glycosyltransferase involved in cell wall biosynthesis
MKKKILLITSHFASKIKHGGIVTVRNNILNIKMQGFLFDEVNLSNKQFALFNILRILFGRSKIIIIGYSDWAVFFSVPLFIFSPQRIIYIPCFHPWFTMRRKFLAFLYENLLFWVFLRAKKIICLSMFEINYLQQKSSRKSIFYYIPMPSFNSNKKLIFRGNKRRIVLFVGRDDENKNLDVFLRIANGLRSSSKVSYYYVVISNTFREFPPWVTHYKNLPEVDLLKIYKSTLVLFVTSKWESLSLVAVEAILSGAKVVCNKNVMFSELRKDFNSLILDNYNDLNVVDDFLSTKISAIEQRNFKEMFSSVRFSRNLISIISA